MGRIGFANHQNEAHRFAVERWHIAGSTNLWKQAALPGNRFEEEEIETVFLERQLLINLRV